MSATVTPTDKVTEDYWTVSLNATKTSVPATRGKIRVYLHEKLVDLSKTVTINVNGVKKFESIPTLDRNIMVEYLAFFFDPQRIFPAFADLTL